MITWTRQRLFHLVHNNNLVYNQCWEDPRLDHKALEISERDRLLVLTSAGCNVLDYLLKSPQSIDAVDMNPRQNALLELKIAGLKKLDYEDFFNFFGQGAHAKSEYIYHSSLRAELPEFARQYWDKHIDFFSPGGWRSSFYYRGTAGIVARMMTNYFGLRGMRDSFEKIFSAENITEQQKIFFDELKPKFFTPYIRWISRRGATMSFLGVPRSQFLQIEKFYAGGMGKFIEDCVEAVFAYLPLKDNYFYRSYVFGSYTKQCCPEYLKEENFLKLRGLVERVNTNTNSVLGLLKTTDKTFSKFVLLDHMDWLYQNQYSVLQEQWQEIFNRATENAKMIWRSASLKVEFVDPISVQIKGKRTTVGQELKYNHELSQSLHRQDRVHTYGSFYIADRVSLCHQ